MKKMRKAATLGFAGLIASAALTACGDAPDERERGRQRGRATSCPASSPTPAASTTSRSTSSATRASSRPPTSSAPTSRRWSPTASNDYGPNLESLVAEGCDAIVTVGFALAAATKESAAANPDIEYVLIDDAADGGDDGQTFDGKADEANIKPLLYDTAQAAFLAGYAAADYSKTGVVGTYGGQPFPTVTIFMDGFKQGVEYYNKEKGKDVKVVGWDGKNGSFTGGFEANETATNTARQLIDQDADVILPVGGPIYQGALTAIDDSGKDVALIGVDADFFETDPKTQDVVLTSILKNMKSLDLRGHHGRRQRRVRLRAVRRHAGERRRRHRAVPQLRGQGVRHRWPTSWTRSRPASSTARSRSRRT